MQFNLIDRIMDLEPGRRVIATKNLTLAEEYLADHFPGFPVMPGVLMLEAVVQTAAWLIRISEDYAHSIIVLKSVKAVKYGSFVAPGRQLIVEAELTRHGKAESELRAKGTADGMAAVSGRITLDRYNLADRDPAFQPVDREIVASLKSQFRLLAREWLERSEPAIQRGSSVVAATP